MFTIRNRSETTSANSRQARRGAAQRTFRRGASERGVSFDLRQAHRGAAQDRSDAERWNEGFPSIYAKRAAERHKVRSDAERRNEGRCPRRPIDRSGDHDTRFDSTACSQLGTGRKQLRQFTSRHRGAAQRTFRRGASERGVSFDLRQAQRRGAAQRYVPTRSVGTRGFLRFTSSAPRSGTKSVPTQSVGTREDALADRSIDRSGDHDTRFDSTACSQLTKKSRKTATPDVAVLSVE